MLFLVTALELLNTTELQMVGDNMKCIINPLNPNVIYNVPNWCICDPVYVKDFETFKNSENLIKEVNVTVILCYVFDNKETAIKISNKAKGKDLKRIYSQMENKPLEKYRLRLLFKGQEIQDEHSLFYHNIENQSRIHVSIAVID